MSATAAYYKRALGYLIGPGRETARGLSPPSLKETQRDSNEEFEGQTTNRETAKPSTKYSMWYEVKGLAEVAECQCD